MYISLRIFSCITNWWKIVHQEDLKMAPLNPSAVRTWWSSVPLLQRSKGIITGFTAILAFLLGSNATDTSAKMHKSPPPAEQANCVHNCRTKTAQTYHQVRWIMLSSQHISVGLPIWSSQNWTKQLQPRRLNAGRHGWSTDSSQYPGKPSPSKAQVSSYHHRKFQKTVSSFFSESWLFEDLLKLSVWVFFLHVLSFSILFNHIHCILVLLSSYASLSLSLLV